MDFFLFTLKKLTPAGQIRDKHEVTRVGVLSARPLAPEKT
jgi:hypothetical protein